MYSTMAPTPVSFSSKTSQQSIRNEHWMFDDAMNERIRSTHVPDDRVVDVTPVLQVTRDVLRQIIPNINLSMNGHIDASDDQTNLSAVDDALDALHKICCEVIRLFYFAFGISIIFETEK
ncbi:hypothetical protein J1N35_009093 [Gossypium stocksii]|uniref:Sieve element occlusion N-terminal domain-containing protein n=1 Tax=Gossypium stocksii TaxID=47602 RepID=A0A9D3WBF9_9ROSI|nr:hypothetical protein J1N35_009093 [Gossypium stocksii]